MTPPDTTVDPEREKLIAETRQQAEMHARVAVQMYAEIARRFERIRATIECLPEIEHTTLLADAFAGDLKSMRRELEEVARLKSQ